MVLSPLPQFVTETTIEKPLSTVVKESRFKDRTLGVNFEIARPFSLLLRLTPRVSKLKKRSKLSGGLTLRRRLPVMIAVAR